MTQERFDIWILGFPEISRAKALSRVAGAFRISEEMASRFVTDEPIRARSDVGQRKAERFQSVLLKIGADVVITTHGADAPDPADFAETSIDEAAPPVPRATTRPAVNRPAAAKPPPVRPAHVARLETKRRPAPPSELPTAPAPPPRRSIRPELPSGYLPAVTDEHSAVGEPADSAKTAAPRPSVAATRVRAAEPPRPVVVPPVEVAASPPPAVAPPVEAAASLRPAAAEPAVRRSIEIPEHPTRRRGVIRRAMPWVVTLLISGGLGVGAYYYYEYSQTALPRVAEARIAGAHQNHLPEFVETDTTERIDLAGATPATLSIPIDRNRCVGVVSTVIGGECDLDATLRVNGQIASVDEYTNATPIVYACSHEPATAELSLESYAGDSCRAGVRVFERMMTSASIDAEIVSIHASRYLADPEPVDRARTHIDLEAGASHVESFDISPGCWGIVGQSSHGSDVDLYVTADGETIARDDAWDNLTVAEYCSESTTALSLEFEMYSGEGELAYQIFRTPHQAGLRVLPQLQPEVVETASTP